MNYYLVSSQATTLSYWQKQAPDANGRIIRLWVENAAVPPSTVMNTIVYDGSAPFTPPTGQTLQTSLNGYSIGDAFNG